MENKKIQSFKDLVVWQRAHLLVVEIYRITKNFPKDEVFGLTNQIRRASVSITSNISEGFNRGSQKEKLNFYFISLGSLAEVESQILIAKDVGYLKPDQSDKIESEIIVIQKLLNSLIKRIKSTTI